jgi:hypothetical protein
LNTICPFQMFPKEASVKCRLLLGLVVLAACVIVWGCEPTAVEDKINTKPVKPANKPVSGERG